MNNKALNTLEYHKITAIISEFADSAAAKEKVLNLVPTDDLSVINRDLDNTNDALSKIYAKGKVSFSGAVILDEALKRLEAGASLGTADLLLIASLLSCTKKVKEYYEETSDSLTYLFEKLYPETNLYKEISRCIISEDEIADDASPGLKNIRRKQNDTRSRIHSSLNSMLSSSVKSALQDPIITMRGDRYCLPVKAENRSQVPGILHDRSATGATLFIEPASVVNLNNDLKQLEIDELKEIEKILEDLSLKCAEKSRSLKIDSDMLIKLDCIFAKAEFSKRFRCTRPVLNTDKKINLKNARHPLIPEGEVVPINISIGYDYDLLIITGPNTGGKTVSLKTVGLFCLLAQSGINIPADDKSEVAVFREIFADIGDEQSIEQSLSTFSSHMTNIAGILKQADESCLILLDEIGAGTDPTEGAALATSILNNFKERGITTIATTHYSELKTYALTTEGVENAGCEFDLKTLRPTYRLLIGVPGKSNAFSISKKLGISDELIADASKRISGEEIRFEDLISELDAAKRTALREQEEINGYKNEIAALRREIKEQQEKINASKDRILENATREASKILSDAKKEADRAVKVMNKEGITLKELEEQRALLRQSSNDKSESLEKFQKPKKAAKKHSKEEFTEGTPVYVVSMDVEGELLGTPDSSGNVEVRIGSFKSKLNIRDMEILKTKKEVQKQQASSNRASRIRLSKSAGISPEINLLGMTGDEGKAALEKYLDDACLSGLARVRIVHGKGTGALRSGIRSYLDSHPNISSHRLGVAGEGGDGVTIAQFK